MTIFLRVFTLLGIPVVVVAASMWRGYVLSILWGWFIVPVFGLPALIIPVAIGISIIAGMLTSQKTYNEATDKDAKKWLPWVTFAVGPAVALLAGWIAQKFI